MSGLVSSKLQAARNGDGSLPNHVRDFILELVELGWTLRGIANWSGVSDNTIRRWCRTYDIEYNVRRDSSRGNPRKRECVGMMLAGSHPVEAARRCRVNERTARRWYVEEVPKHIRDARTQVVRARQLEADRQIRERNAS